MEELIQKKKEYQERSAAKQAREEGVKNYDIKMKINI